MPNEYYFPERLMHTRRELLNKRRALMDEVKRIDSRLRELDAKTTKSYIMERDNAISHA